MSGTLKPELKSKLEDASIPANFERVNAWDQSWAAIWAWCTTINWGDAPGWVGAIGTAGALFLGMLILRNDRLRMKRAEADSFASWHVLENSGGDSPILEVNFYNAGNKPLLGASVHSWDGTIWRRKLVKGRNGVFVIPPDDAPRVRVPLSTQFERKNYFLSFVDNSNVEWFRTVRDNKYISAREVSRWRNRKPDGGR